MFRKLLIASVAPLGLIACAQSAAATTINVTKAASCTCCEGWVEHMRKAGYTVVVHEVEDVTPTAKRLGVPASLRSCHTGEVAGYVIEGHVPAADVKRLLAEHPKAAGLAVPGMVVGSPGMEVGGRAEHYRVILFDRSGKSRTFASH
jgi:hypothetical protein